MAIDRSSERSRRLTSGPTTATQANIANPDPSLSDKRTHRHWQTLVGQVLWKEKKEKVEGKDVWPLSTLGSNRNPIAAPPSPLALPTPPRPLPPRPSNC